MQCRFRRSNFPSYIPGSFANAVLVGCHDVMSCVRWNFVAFVLCWLSFFFLGLLLQLQILVWFIFLGWRVDICRYCSSRKLCLGRNSFGEVAEGFGPLCLLKVCIQACCLLVTSIVRTTQFFTAELRSVLNEFMLQYMQRAKKMCSVKAQNLMYWPQEPTLLPTLACLPATA